MNISKDLQQISNILKTIENEYPNLKFWQNRASFRQNAKKPS